jgi:hypothetical protein
MKRDLGKFILSSIFLLIGFSSALPLASAISISPAIQRFNFDPAFDQTFSFNIGGQPGRDTSVALGGSLAPYATLSTDYIKGGSGSVTARLVLPQELPPGKQVLEVRAIEEIPGNDGFSARAGVISMIVIEVPYPGLYATVKLIVAEDKGGVNQGEDTPFTFTLINQGKEDLSGTRAEVILKDAQGAVLERVSFDSIAIKSQEQYTRSGLLRTSALAPSDYRATLEYSYADKLRESSVAFRVGSFDVDLANYTKTVTKGGIVPYSVTIKNLWKGAIEAKAIIMATGAATVTTESKSITDFGSVAIPGFLDTTNLLVGQNQAVITLNAIKESNRSVNISKAFLVTFMVVEAQAPEKERAMFFSGITTIHIVLVVLVLLLLVNGFFIAKAFGKKK